MTDAPTPNPASDHRWSKQTSWGLEGKVVLVTGAASGIGEATARLAAADGARVIVCDLASSSGQAVADEIGGHFIALDVTSATAWKTAATEIDHLHIAILNAGVEFRAPGDFLRTKDDPGAWNFDDYRRATGVNIDGVALGMHTLVPIFDRMGGGAITVTASLAGLIPWTPDPIYSMTKWAIVGLVRASAPGLRQRKITINVVCPGAVATPLTRIFDGSVPPGMADPAHIATAHLGLATSDLTGRVVKAVVGHEHEAHRFAEVTGVD